MHLSHFRKLIPITTIAATCLFGLTEVSAQTLLLRYTFDESTNGTENATDSSGASPAAPGTFVGATRVGTTPDGISTGAMNSTGAAAGNLKYVTAGDVDKLDGLLTFTLTAWVNVQELPNGNRRIMSKQTPTPLGFTWNFGNPANLEARSAAAFGTRLFIGGEFGFAFDPVLTTTIDADNKWVFLAVTYDGTAGASAVDNVKHYIGSTTTATTNAFTSTITAGTSTASTAAFHIGHTDAAPANSLAFPGWLDDARVYSGVLDAAALDAVRLQNLGASPNAVLITNPSRTGTTVTFSFQTQAGKTHSVEYKNSITDASWLPLTVVIGDGDVEEVTDLTAIPATRFYQVKTQ